MLFFNFMIHTYVPRNNATIADFVALGAITLVLLYLVMPFYFEQGRPVYILSKDNTRILTPIIYRKLLQASCVY